MAQRASVRAAERTFFQKWILDAKPGYAIMFIAPWSSIVGLITAYHKTVGDNSFFFFTKKQQFMGEDARDSDCYTFPFIGGRKRVQEYIDKKRAAIGAENIRISQTQTKRIYNTRDDFDY